jgi:hypothetical protein
MPRTPWKDVIALDEVAVYHRDGPSSTTLRHAKRIWHYWIREWALRHRADNPLGPADHSTCKSSALSLPLASSPRGSSPRGSTASPL